MAKHKESLETVITELERRNIGVTGNGTITDNSPSAPSEVTGVIRPSKEEMEAASRRITRILWEATETDRIAKNALRAIMKDQHDFSGAGAGSLKEADMRQGREQAEKWKKDYPLRRLQAVERRRTRGVQPVTRPPPRQPRLHRDLLHRHRRRPDADAVVGDRQ
jgi:hypothetical protein